MPRAQASTEADFSSGVGLTEGYKCASPKGLNRGRDGTYEDSDLQAEIDFFKQKAVDCNTYSANNDNIGKRIGTPYVARDIRALMQVINDDKLIRYYGECP